MLLGLAGSAALLLLRAHSGSTMIPFSYGLVAALLCLPFPQADYAFALSVVAPFPLLPAIGSLPNLPVGVAVIAIALARLIWASRRPLIPLAMAVLGCLWIPLLIGVAIARSPAPSVWLRPAAILVVMAMATLLGLAVWSDPDRRGRWVQGLTWVLLASVGSGLIVFLLQYVMRVAPIVNHLADLLGYLRGDAAGQKFAVANNWLIWSQTVTLRAVSPLFPSPNNLGGLIGLLAPFAVVEALLADKAHRRIVALLTLFLTAIVLVVTYSRSSLAAAGACAVFAVGLAWVASRSGNGQPGPQALNRRRLAGVVLALAVGFGLGGVGFATAHGPVINDPGLKPSPAARITDALGDPSVTIRISISEHAITQLVAHPLRGNGLGNWAASTDAGARAYVHDVFLEYGAAAGILGFLWVILLVAIPIIGGWLAARRNVPLVGRAMGAAVAAVAVFAAVQFLFDDNLLNPQYAWLLGLVVGLGTAALSRSPESLA